MIFYLTDEETNAYCMRGRNESYSERRIYSNRAKQGCPV